MSRHLSQLIYYSYTCNIVARLKDPEYVESTSNNQIWGHSKHVSKLSVSIKDGPILHSIILDLMSYKFFFCLTIHGCFFLVFLALSAWGTVS